MTHDFSALGIVPDKEKVLGGVDSAGMGLGRSVDAIEALLNFPSMHMVGACFEGVYDVADVSGQVQHQTRFDKFFFSVRPQVVVSFLPSLNDNQERKRNQSRGEWARLEAERRFEVLAQRGILHLSIFPETTISEEWLQAERARFEAVRGEAEPVGLVQSVQQADDGVRIPDMELAAKIGVIVNPLGS